jgi:diaminopimelate decarboxylase
LRDALPPGFVIFYPLQANPHPDVANALCEVAGRPACRAEVGSVTELAVALEAGFNASECLYLGSGKTESDLIVAVAWGVQTFSVESLSDLERVGSVARRFGTVVDCLLRISTAGLEAGSRLGKTGTSPQLGIDSDTLREQLPMLRSVVGVRVVGAHFTALGHAQDEQSLVAELAATVGAAARLFAEFCLPLRILNIGGGFVAPYAVPGPRPVYRNLRAELESALDAHFPCWRVGTPRIACEAGCYLVGDCGELISTVTNIKERGGRKFVILDVGTDTAGDGPTPFEPPLFAADDVDAAALAGPGSVPDDAPIRDVEVGDVVTVPNVGAYDATARLLLFLDRPAPREVVIQGGKIVTVSRLQIGRILYVQLPANRTCTPRSTPLRYGLLRRYPAYWATILVKSYGFWLMLLQVPGAQGSTAPAGQGWSRLNDQNVNHAT